MRTLLLGLACVVVAGCGPHVTLVEPPVRASVTVTPALAVVTWEKGLNAQSTLVARTSSNAAPTAPTGDVEVGAPLGSANVVAISQDTSFTDNKLPTECGPFSWHLWSRAADGTWAKTAATVRSALGEHTLAPTADVTGLGSVVEGSKLRVYWTLPDVSTGFHSATLVRKRGSPPMSSTDGTVIYDGPTDNALEPLTALSATESTFYAVFNCNLCKRCSATGPSIPVTAPTDGGVTLDVSALTARLSSDGQFVDLAWNSNAPALKLLRTVNAMPSGPTDANATVVFQGQGTSTRERLDALLPHQALDPHRYRYTLWACAGTQCSATPSSVEFTFTLTQALQGGGYSLYFQHATANTCADLTTLGTASTTLRPNWWKSCDASCATATAAQLTTATSDTEVSRIKSFLQAKSVPVSRVVSSEFCRAVQTAQGFGLDAGVLEQVQQLTYFVYEEANRCNDTRSMLNGQPAAGTNAVFVGHGNFPGACPPFDALNAADALVYKPTLGAPAKYVARVGSTDWATLP